MIKSRRPVFSVLQHSLGQGCQLCPHAPADLRLLALLLGADLRAAQAQLVLFRIGLGLMEPLLQLLLGPADLAELFCHAVRNVKATGPGVVRVQDGQSRPGVVEGELPQGRNLAHLRIQGQQAFQPLQIALDLKQLHMVRHLSVSAAADRVADVLHLAQQDTDLVIHALELVGVVCRLLHVI